MMVANLVGFVFGLEGLKSSLIEAGPLKVIEMVMVSFFIMYSSQNVTLWLETRRDGVQVLEPSNELETNNGIETDQEKQISISKSDGRFL